MRVPLDHLSEYCDINSQLDATIMILLMLPAGSIVRALYHKL